VVASRPRPELFDAVGVVVGVWKSSCVVVGAAVVGVCDGLPPVVADVEPVCEDAGTAWAARAEAATTNATAAPATHPVKRDTRRRPGVWFVWFVTGPSS